MCMQANKDMHKNIIKIPQKIEFILLVKKENQSEICLILIKKCQEKIFIEDHQ